MNAPANITPRAEPLPALFEAWIAGEAASRRLDVSGATTLHEARDAAAQFCKHKDHFLIKRTDRATGEAMLHCYYVKQKAPTWVRKPGFAHVVQVRPLEAELRFSMAVNAFAPVEPWRWTPGADVVGIDRDVVEARRA